MEKTVKILWMYLGKTDIGELDNHWKTRDERKQGLSKQHRKMGQRSQLGIQQATQIEKQLWAYDYDDIDGMLRSTEKKSIKKCCTSPLCIC